MISAKSLTKEELQIRSAQINALLPCGQEGVKYSDLAVERILLEAELIYRELYCAKQESVAAGVAANNLKPIS